MNANDFGGRTPIEQAALMILQRGKAYRKIAADVTRPADEREAADMIAIVCQLILADVITPLLIQQIADTYGLTIGQVNTLVTDVMLDRVVTQGMDELNTFLKSEAL